MNAADGENKPRKGIYTKSLDAGILNQRG